MLTISTPSAALVTTHGSVDPVLQASWRLSDGPAGLHLTLTLRGKASQIASVYASADGHVGATGLPSEVSLGVSGGEIICESAEMQGESGGLATLTLGYRERNARETDEDCASGLLSRTISTRWIERQEMLEHFMARKSDGFDATAFAAWMGEPDAAVKASYSYNDETGNQIALSGNTLAAAERFNMGVQYAALFMLQIEVNELWRVPVNTSAACNVKIESIPPTHKPLFGVDGLENTFSFMRASDTVQHRGGCCYARSVVYLCLPQGLTPTNPPHGWGNGPIDELLYGARTSESRGESEE